MMTLDIGTLLSLAGISWMTPYFDEFGLKVEDMKSVACNQPFVFGPSKRYVSKLLVELPILISRMDGKEDVLTVQTYLVDAEVPFRCGKQNFKLDGNDITLEIQMKTEKDNDKKLIRMIDTAGGHYRIVLETKKKSNANSFLVEEDSGILFVQDEKGDLCSYNQSEKCMKSTGTKEKIN